MIDFLKSFKQVKKAYLKDAANVNCKNSDDRIDLSLYKLITSYIGFYQKFGFRLVIEHDIEEDITNKILRKKIKSMVERLTSKYYDKSVCVKTLM